MRDSNGDTAVPAGGQSLVLDATNGDTRPGRVVDTNGVPEFEALTTLHFEGPASRSP